MLPKKGHDVLCLNNFFTGSKENIAHLIVNPNFELVRHDLVDPSFWRSNVRCQKSEVRGRRSGYVW